MINDALAHLSLLLERLLGSRRNRVLGVMALAFAVVHALQGAWPSAEQVIQFWGPAVGWFVSDSMRRHEVKRVSQRLLLTTVGQALALGTVALGITLPPSTLEMILGAIATWTLGQGWRSDAADDFHGSPQRSQPIEG